MHGPSCRGFLVFLDGGVLVLFGGALVIPQQYHAWKRRGLDLSNFQIVFFHNSTAKQCVDKRSETGRLNLAR